MTVRQIVLGVLASAYFISNMSALPILEVEGNDSLAMAQEINAFFSTEFSPDIGHAQPGVNTSTWIPHVSISGSRSLTDSDFFKFGVNENSTGIFDIDYAADRGHDTRLQLYTAAGELLAANDMYPGAAGAGGSVNPHDPFIQYSLDPGEYIIDVVTSIFGPDSGSYVLQVSISNPGIPARVPDNGATISLIGIAMLCIAGVRRMLPLTK